jgi:hypothetical protein
MLEPDVTTSEVLIMYAGIFAFLFGLAFFSAEEKFLIFYSVKNSRIAIALTCTKLRVIEKF